MKEDTIAIVFDLIVGVITVIIIGGIIWVLPYQQAAKRDAREAVIIDDYLKEQDSPVYAEQIPDESEEPDTMAEQNVSMEVEHNKTSAITAPTYKGEIDSILIIDKTNLQKAIIRGPDNDYNLERYLFVTADQTSALGVDNYVIYGHCSQTYGHSFNRLEELAIGDTFQLIQGTTTYHYEVTDIQLELREDASPLLNTESNTVQLVSCEKKRLEGYPEKRLIIVTATENSEG